ncbi:disulfide bond corrector protein DsbC [Stenotrophomonas rhizophila]|uniref:protein-disulfide reductase DsbD domain-containing protein n=1 Tax=Stenotrophomonas rhizophila TaxID=216778 RepID=UPI000F4B5FE6|nr:protein-disulfide reductase DsbD domain-containing protein [Stenotrophomonas rhizophila]ROP80566.1 disulfide bond corrector protein DsbC [Stenotrophomonas rhizophila]
MNRSLLAIATTLLLTSAGAGAADTPKVALDPRLEARADGTRELVIDARIEPGWILYASDFEQPQIGPRAARISLANGAQTEGPLRSVDAREGHGRSFAGDYRYTYFSERGQLRLPIAAGNTPVNGILRAQVCFEESGLCELVQQEIAAR